MVVIEIAFLLAYPASRHPSVREAALGRPSTTGGGLPLWNPNGWVSGGWVGEEIPRWQFKLPLWQFNLPPWQFNLPPRQLNLPLWLTTLGRPPQRFAENPASFCSVTFEKGARTLGPNCLPSFVFVRITSWSVLKMTSVLPLSSPCPPGTKS
jgi:hypothetical protein